MPRLPAPLRGRSPPAGRDLSAPRTLVTGATGFIGSHVARLAMERGDEVRLGVEEGSVDTALDGLDAARVRLEVRDRRSVRRALQGIDRVFHCAGVTSVRPGDTERLFAVNVVGTKLVLEESLRAGVERVVHTSSAAAIGPAPTGGAADETQLFTAGHLGIPYVNSVHEGEVEAMRLAARGLPLVCVNPTIAFGAGDHHVTSTRLVRSFLLGRVPIYTDGAVNVVDIRDVAAGHMLADERGAVGERYILGGRNFTFDRLFADLGRISGIEPPVKLAVLPARAAAFFFGGGGHPGPGGGACGQPVVDLSGHQGAPRARMGVAPPRGDARGRGGLAPRARARPDRPQPPLPAASVPGGRCGPRRGRRDGGPGPARRRSSARLTDTLRAWPRSTAARRPPTASAAAGGWRAGCTQWASSSTRCGCPCAGVTAPRSRSSPGSAGFRCSSTTAR